MVGPLLLVVPGPVSLVALGVVVLVAWARWVVSGTLSARTPFDLPLLLYLVGAVIGLVVSGTPNFAFDRFLGLLGCAATFYCLVNWCTNWRRLKFGLWLFCGSAALAVLILMTQTPRGAYPSSALVSLVDPVLRWLSSVPQHAAEAGSVWNIRPNGFAGVLAAIVPFAAAAAIGNRKWRLPFIGLAILPFVGLLLTSSRGALVGLFVGLAAALFVSKGTWKVGLGLLGAVPVSFGLMLTPLMGKADKTWSLLGDLATSERMGVWKVGWSMLVDHPFTGIGLSMENFQRYMSWYASPTMLQGGAALWVLPHSHNFYLQTYLEQGILGFLGVLIAVVVALVYGWRTVRRLRDRRLRLVTLACVASFTSVAVHGLVDSVPSQNLGTCLFWLPLAFMVICSRIDRTLWRNLPESGQAKS